MSDTQETIWLIKKVAISRDAQGNIIGTSLEEKDVKARYTRAKAKADCDKNNINPKAKFSYRFVRLKLS